MTLKPVRKKLDASNVMQWATAASSITKQLVDLSAFPPAQAAASILLLIFQTIQSISANQAACERLAKRAANLLFDIGDQMNGRWDDAPPLLIKNLKRFQETLTDIYLYMKKETQAKWTDRFLRKLSIEDALADFNLQLDQAIQSFQVATLINIHYDVNVRRVIIQKPALEDVKTPDDEFSAPPPYTPDSSSGAVPSDKEKADAEIQSPTGSPPVYEGVNSSEKFAGEILVAEEVIETIEDDHGYRRFHQSDIVLRGRSRLKEGWWLDALEVQIDGRQTLVKRYQGSRAEAAKAWARDVKILQNLHHPNLPQMIGFSENDTSTPFIVLTNVATKSPQNLLQHTIRTKSLAAAAELMLRFYQDISDAALHLQRQMNFSESQLQDFIQDASFRVDDMAIVLGLPPPKEGHWVTMRNYGLTVTLRDTCLTMLPNKGLIDNAEDDKFVSREQRRRVNHLLTLARGFLPAPNDPPGLPDRIKSVLDEVEGDQLNALTLRQLRMDNLDHNHHNHSWTERTVPAHRFVVGELGYIPDGGDDFKNFVTLRKVPLPIEKQAWGEQWCWADIPIRRQPLQSFDLPVDEFIVHEAYAQSMTEAWRYLLDNGKKLAVEFNVKPDELILVTRVGTNQDFYIRQFGPILGFPHHIGAPPPVRPGFQQPRTFGHQPMAHHMPHAPFPQALLPKIFYLLTSPDEKHEPYWTQTPVSLPPGVKRPDLERGYPTKIGWKHGFLNYVQLHAEDFSD